jgi:xylan 1,4-beta-xylosidase
MDPSLNQDTRARTQWEEQIGQRSNETLQCPIKIDLPPPDGLWAESGAGLVTHHWQPVDHAVGYLVHRSKSADGPFKRIDHGGGDVLAVPGTIYADTTGVPGEHYWYAVASIFDASFPPGELSAPVKASSKADNAAPLVLNVQVQTSAGKLHPAWHMIGTEHLSQLFYSEGAGSLVDAWASRTPDGTILDEQALPDVFPTSGIAHFAFDLPMPGVVLLRLRPI